jgi:hypothetical protein
MKLLADEAFFEIEEVVEACGVHIKTILLGIDRNATHWKGIKLPDQDQRRTWIEYSCMKDEYKEMLRNRYFGGEDPVMYQKMQDMNPNVVRFFEAPELTLAERLEQVCCESYKQYEKKFGYVKTENQKKREQQIKCLARTAAVLEEIAIYYKEKGWKFGKHQGYEEAGKWLKENERRYFPLKYIPTNARKIKEKIDALVKYEKLITDVVVMPRAGNEHPALYSGEQKKEILGLVIRQMISGKGWSDMQLIRMIKRRYTLWNELVPSDATIRRLMETPSVKLIVANGRYDEGTKKRQKYRHSTPLEKAMFAGDCWEMDGTKVQWQGFEVDGVRRSLYIVVVRDVYSGSYLGWSYGLSENSDMYFEALKMAVETQGYLPYELRVDQFSKNEKIENVFAQIEKYGVKYTIGKLSTSKAAVERGFKTLQEVFESELDTWIGEGILSSDENSRPTAEWLKKNAKKLKVSGWNWDAAWTAHNVLMMQYNSTKLSAYSKRLKRLELSPIELHSTCEKPHRVHIEIWEMASLFWAKETRAIRNYKLVFERRDGDKVFDFNDEKYLPILKKYNEVTVRYDNQVLDEVMIFDPITDEFLCSVKAFSKIQLYGPSAEYDRNVEYQNRRKEVQTALKKERDDYLEASQRDVDEASLRMGALIGKDLKEAAEMVAMENYRYNAPPTSERVLNSTKSKAKRPEKTVKKESVEQCIEALGEDDIFEQLKDVW